MRLRLPLLAFVVLLVPATAWAQGGTGLGQPGATEPAPTQPAQPTQPTQPAHPSQPAQPTQPGQPTQPAQPATPPSELPPPELGPATGPTDVGPASDPDARMRALVIDAATFGIDPVVGRVTTAQMRQTSEAMGYVALDRDATVSAAQQLRMPYPPTPADLWRVSWIARVHRGSFAKIWAHAGQYVIEITVASLDGSGPFFARGTAGSDDLRQVVDQLLRTALPAPGVWDAAGAQRAGTVAQPAPAPTESIDELDEFDDTREEQTPAAPAEPEPELRRWGLSVQTEAAIGAAEDVYYNHLLGARLDFRITRDIALGVYVAWANLNARDGRADNILFMLQFENRIRLAPDLDLTIPLRAAVGYLPFNGPVIRLSAGLNYAVSEDFEIGIDLLTPTFWFLPNGAAVSLDIALEGTLRF